MQIFKFERRSCKLSFLFVPCYQSAAESLRAGNILKQYNAGCELKTVVGSGNFNNKSEWDFQYLWVWDEGKIVGYWNFNQRWAESVSVCTCSPPLLSSRERQLGNDACQSYPLSSYVLFFLFWHKCCFSYSGVLHEPLKQRSGFELHVALSAGLSIFSWFLFYCISQTSWTALLFFVFI